jgi:hypothetical protein
VEYFFITAYPAWGIFSVTFFWFLCKGQKKVTPKKPKTRNSGFLVLTRCNAPLRPFLSPYK